MMLGPDVVEEYQEKLRVVVDRVRGDGTGVFNWEDVYQDPTAKGIALPFTDRATTPPVIPASTCAS